MRTKTWIKESIKKLIMVLCGKDFFSMRLNQDYEFVFLDIYDTAVFRIVENPKDVFDIVQKLFCKDHIWSYPESFKDMRIEAEKRARKKSLHGEVTLKDIYDCFALLEEKEKKTLQDMEISVERQVAYCNPEFKPFYENLLAQGIDIVFISDMYLRT